MQFLKDMIGGAVIILAAGAIGLVVNTMREKPVKLILSTPPAVARHDGNADADKEKPSAEEPAAADEEVSQVPILTDEEVLTGEISMARVRWLIEAQTIVLVDARGVTEYIEGHLPGAINIPYDSFVDYYDTLLDAVAMDADVVCYCRSVDCDLSENLAQEMKLMGYERVTCYRGGIIEWEEAGHELETPK